MEDINFRRNVEPEKRRKAAKNIIELNDLKARYNECDIARSAAEKKLNDEQSSLNSAIESLEEARNVLASAQEEIDADYLPENAQPRARIQKRDVAQMVVM
jgi:hypothetical protein